MTVDEAIPGIKRLLVRAEFNISGLVGEIQEIDEKIREGGDDNRLRTQRASLVGQLRRRKTTATRDVTNRLDDLGRGDLAPYFTRFIARRLGRPGAFDRIGEIFSATDERI